MKISKFKMHPTEELKHLPYTPSCCGRQAGRQAGIYQFSKVQTFGVYSKKPPQLWLGFQKTTTIRLLSKNHRYYANFSQKTLMTQLLNLSMFMTGQTHPSGPRGTGEMVQCNGHYLARITSSSRSHWLEIPHVCNGFLFVHMDFFLGFCHSNLVWYN